MNFKREDPHEQNVLIGISAIMDFRLAALFRLYGKKVLCDEYFSRERDVWEEVSPEFDSKAVNTLIESREKGIMPLAKMTSLCYVIKDMMKSLREEVLSRVDLTEINVTINLEGWPFTVAEIETLKVIIIQWVGVTTSINVINIKPEDITVAKMIDYVCVWMYDFKKWMSSNLSTIGEGKLVRNCFFAPGFIDTYPDDPDLAQLDPGDLLDMTEQSLRPLLNLTLLDPNLFNAYVPPVKKEES